mmetsp:Transcript_13147/g.52469  ORF Transcript_13147/g.52469 Transcript_13147/m.52469 type:complete len:283 (-) Transcript_13147:1446-2294(-)
MHQAPHAVRERVAEGEPLLLNEYDETLQRAVVGVHAELRQRAQLACAVPLFVIGEEDGAAAGHNLDEAADALDEGAQLLEPAGAVDRHEPVLLRVGAGRGGAELVELPVGVLHLRHGLEEECVAADREVGDLLVEEVVHLADLARVRALEDVDDVEVARLLRAGANADVRAAPQRLELLQLGLDRRHPLHAVVPAAQLRVTTTVVRAVADHAQQHVLVPRFVRARHRHVARLGHLRPRPVAEETKVLVLPRQRRDPPAQPLVCRHQQVRVADRRRHDQRVRV